MSKPRKFWFCFAIGAVAVSVALALVLILFQAQRTNAPPSSISVSGSLSPPPGPHETGDLWVADLDGWTGMEMVWCPPGKFLMGSPGSEPDRQPYEPNEFRHEVILTQGFWLGKYEVTQAQWMAIMGTNPSSFKGNDLPVEMVSWNEAGAFCKKLTDRAQASGTLTVGYEYRLPTEAEWEYACRAGSTGPIAGTGVLKEMGWYSRNSGGKTHPVGTKQANAWGLYDMHGNVGEWCQDWYDKDYPSDDAVTDPTGPVTGDWHVIRGGCWRYWYCSSAVRKISSGEKSYDRGFRVVFSAVKPAPPSPPSSDPSTSGAEQDKVNRPEQLGPSGRGTAAKP